MELRLTDVVVERNGREVLADVSLVVETGEFVLVVGPNGAGKTTLLSLCNGLLSPAAGSVTLNGTPVGADPLYARSNVGMVFQEPRDQLVEATVAADVAFGPENLGLDRDEIEDTVAEALEAVGYADAGDRSVIDLSHGERTRIAIAGALAMQPAVLVLDEPLVGLDRWGRQRILEHIRDCQAQGTSVLLATHDLRDVASVADRAIALKDGTVVLDQPTPVATDRLLDLGVQPPP